MSHRVLCFVAVLVFSIATASAQSNFKRFNFDVGGGLGIGRGDVGKFVGGSYFGIAGGGLNLNRMFGFNAEYMYYDLPLKPSVIQQLTSGTVCQPAWIWWDVACVNGFVSPAQTLSSAGKDAGGFNFGGGVTYRLNHLHRAKVYVEARYHRAYHSDVQTTFIPVAVGLRW